MQHSPAPSSPPSALPMAPACVPPTLLERLFAAADLWVETCGASRAKLGRVVINDGGFFGRLEQPAASTTTATLERFARFLGDPANWPGGVVPAGVCAFVRVVGVASEACSFPSRAPVSESDDPCHAGASAGVDGGAPSGRPPVSSGHEGGVTLPGGAGVAGGGERAFHAVHPDSGEAQDHGV